MSAGEALDEAQETDAPEVEAEEEVEAAEEEGPPDWCWGTGRRKSAVARVRLRPGSAKIEVNGQTMEAYFDLERHRARALEPLGVLKIEGTLDVFANINGGGITGQADAMRLGVARALLKHDGSVEKALRDGGFLTRDSRMTERKKYGHRKARARFQFSKR